MEIDGLDGLQGAQPGTMDIALQEVGGHRVWQSANPRSWAMMMMSNSRRRCPGSVRPLRTLRKAASNSCRSESPMSLAPRDGITSGPGAPEVTAYAVGRSSSHRSTSLRRQPTARDPRPPSLTGCGKSPERLRRHNEVRDRPVNSSTVRVRKITG